MNQPTSEERLAEYLQANGLNSYDEAVQKFLEQVSENIDPRDYMTPTQREIMDMDLDTLKAEYAMVQSKTNPRGAMQRRLICNRYEYETRTDVGQPAAE